MKILVDIGHPAHVHLFKNLISHFKSLGHFVYVTAREKDIVIELLNHYQIPHEVISSSAKTPFGMVVELIRRDLRIFRLNRRYKFDFTLGTSVSITHLTFLYGVPSYNFNEDDDDYIPLYVYLTYPFATKIINPITLRFSKWISKRVLYPSLHELAYLHPNNFKKDPEVIKKYELTPGQYIIVRLSALAAHHDLSAEGISKELELKIEKLAEDYQIIYSREITKNNQIDTWEMHQILAHSKMLISDSQSMTIEAAVLGVPSVRYSSFVGRSSVIEELENKYELSCGFSPGEESAFLETIEEMLNNNDLHESWMRKRGLLLKDKIDFNDWMKEYFKSELNI